jgi:HEAT repeat protein
MIKYLLFLLYLAWLKSAVSDPDAKVRVAAIRACAYVGWIEFSDVLAEIKESDSDEDVRSRAEAVFNALSMTEEERVALIKQRRGEE